MIEKNKLLRMLCAAVITIPLFLSSCSDKDTETDSSDTADTSILKNTYVHDPNAPSTANGNLGEVQLETGNVYAVISVKDYGDITVKLFPDIAPDAVGYFVSAANNGYYDGKNFHRIISDFMIQGGSLYGDGLTDADGVKYGVEKSPNARHFYGAIAMGKNSLGENGLQFYLVNNKNTDEFIKMQTQLPEIEEYAASIKATLDEIDAYITENGDGDVNQNAVIQYQQLYDYYGTLSDYIKNADSAVIEKYGEQGGVPFLDGGYTVFGQTVEGFDIIDKISAAEVIVSPSNKDEISYPIKEIIIDKVEIKTY